MPLIYNTRQEKTKFVEVKSIVESRYIWREQDQVSPMGLNEMDLFWCSFIRGLPHLLTGIN